MTYPAFNTPVEYDTGPGPCCCAVRLIAVYAGSYQRQPSDVHPRVRATSLSGALKAKALVTALRCINAYVLTFLKAKDSPKFIHRQ